MFNEVNNFLNLKGDDSSLTGQSILVSDFTSDDGAFLVHHFISYFLKKSPQCETKGKKHVCLVSFTQSLNHYRCVAQKFGLNLRQLQENGSLAFVDGLQFLGKAIVRPRETTENNGKNPLAPALLQQPGNMKDFFLYLKSIFNSNEDETLPVVIIDNLAVLLSLGVPLSQLTAFYQCLRSYICVERRGSLVVYVNITEEDEREQLLLKHFCHMSNCQLQIRGLSTGYCKDIHGELTATWYELSPLAKHRSKMTQFKLLDKNVSLFAAGMSQAVL